MRTEPFYPLVPQLLSSLHLLYWLCDKKAHNDPNRLRIWRRQSLTCAIFSLLSPKSCPLEIFFLSLKCHDDVTARAVAQRASDLRSKVSRAVRCPGLSVVRLQRWRLVLFVWKKNRLDSQVRCAFTFVFEMENCKLLLFKLLSFLE